MNQLSIKIEKSIYGGYGLGFMEGKAVMVLQGVPGDLLDIEITADKKDYSFARILEVREPSPHRVRPECPNFGLCGGCDYLHVNYEAELSIKRDILRDSMRRAGGIKEETLPPIELIADDRFGYRSHAGIKNSADGRTGFFRRDTNELVPFPPGGCRLLSGKITEALHGPVYSGRQEFRAAVGARGDILFSFRDGGPVREEVNGIIYERDLSSFFQANGRLRPRMLDAVRGAAEIRGGRFLDVACGVGFFALCLAADAEAGLGIDIDRESIRQARRNARINRIGNVKFAAMPADALQPALPAAGAIIVDPPRAGLSKKARAALAGVASGRLVYVSCNPATFARDARDFCGAGYALARMILIDMFPATAHIEVISVFTK